MLPIQTIERNKIWFEYILNKEKPRESHFRCRLCFKYYDKFRLAKNYKNALAFEKGALKTTKEENREIIQKHANIPGHKAIIDKLITLKKETLPTDFQNIQSQEEKNNNNFLEITMRMFRTVFFEVKKNIPFEAHNALIDLQKFNGIDMGYHHYSRKSATSMIEVMSNLMHENLMTHLVSINSPVSIILDGSTDLSRTHNMLVYFLAVEDYAPVMYFYKLIECSLDQSADGLFTALENAFSKEKVDFIKYLKNNLIGYISDGAPVMIGKNGLVSKLRSMVNQPVYSVHCMAHKLHLAITKSFDKSMYFRNDFEKNIDNLVRFYNFHSTKRKAHLVKTGIHFKIKLYEIHFISQTRWISSEFKILTNVKKNWFLYVNDLKAIASDKNFDKKTKDKAHLLHSIITGVNFLSALHFVLDVLMHLSYWSQRLQERYGLLVGFSSFYAQIMDTFDHLKIENGRFLKTFLSQTYCYNEITDENVTCDTFGHYESADVVTYSGIVLHEDYEETEQISEKNAPPLSKYRQDFLESLISSIKNYFPEDDTKNFDIFLPTNLPSEESKIISYGVNEIISICMFFKWNEQDDNCESLLNEWIILLRSIISSPKFCTFNNDQTSVFAFWAQFLKMENIAWTIKTKKMIKTILVLPVGSAEAERGFSVLNILLKSKRTNRLTDAHVNDLLRIKINGPDSIHEFAANKYAKEWLKQNHRRTDDPLRKKMKASDFNDDIENIGKKWLPKSTLF